MTTLRNESDFRPENDAPFATPGVNESATFVEVWPGNVDRAIWRRSHLYGHCGYTAQRAPFEIFRAFPLDGGGMIKP